MNTAEQLQNLKEQVLPKLEEFGLRGFVLVGYLETDEGAKRVCFVNFAKEPAYEDGLSPFLRTAHIWGTPPEAPPPPTTE